MPSYSVARTKDHLSALIERARAGEEVVITKHGKATARIVAADFIAPAKDVAGATRRLRAWRQAQAPIKVAIPYERFYEWLYEDRED